MYCLYLKGQKENWRMYYMQTKWVFVRSVEHVFHVYVPCCLERPLLFSLSASADKKWASCLQKSLSFYPFVLGSQTAGKVRQVHPFLLAQGNPFWWDDPSILLVTRIVFMVHENLELFISGWLLPLLFLHLTSALTVQIALLGRQSCCCYLWSDYFPIHF